MTNLLPKMFLICSTTYLISSCTDVSLSVMLFCCYFIKIMQYYLKIVQTLLLHISLIVKMVGWEGGGLPKNNIDKAKGIFNISKLTCTYYYNNHFCQFYSIRYIQVHVYSFWSLSE